MKDVFGTDIKVGDTVAFNQPGYTYELKTGTVVRLTEKKLVINWQETQTVRGTLKTTYKFPEQVAVNNQDVVSVKTIKDKENADNV